MTGKNNEIFVVHFVALVSSVFLHSFNIYCSCGTGLVLMLMDNACCYKSSRLLFTINCKMLTVLCKVYTAFRYLHA